MRGRKPKPTKLKLIEGNPGRRPLNQDEPKPALEALCPDPPEHLGEVAQQEWRRVSEELHRLGLLTRVDSTALAAYCQSYERWVQAERAIAKVGLLTKTTGGNAVQNPLIGIANRSMELMYRFLVEFGMTPSSRSRIRVSKGDEDAGGVLNGEWAGGAKKSTG